MEMQAACPHAAGLEAFENGLPAMRRRANPMPRLKIMMKSHQISMLLFGAFRQGLLLRVLSFFAANGSSPFQHPDSQHLAKKRSHRAPAIYHLAFIIYTFPQSPLDKD
jgi:hypothetical protein